MLACEKEDVYIKIGNKLFKAMYNPWSGQIEYYVEVPDYRCFK